MKTIYTVKRDSEGKPISLSLKKEYQNDPEFINILKGAINYSNKYAAYRREIKNKPPKPKKRIQKVRPKIDMKDILALLHPAPKKNQKEVASQGDKTPIKSRTLRGSPTKPGVINFYVRPKKEGDTIGALTDKLKKNMKMKTLKKTPSITKPVVKTDNLTTKTKRIVKKPVFKTKTMYEPGDFLLKEKGKRQKVLLTDRDKDKIKLVNGTDSIKYMRGSGSKERTKVTEGMLVAGVRKFLTEMQMTRHEFYRLSGISVSWQIRFLEGNIKDPGANRTEYIFNFFGGDWSKLDPDL